MDKNGLFPHQRISKEVKIEYNNIYELFKTKLLQDQNKEFIFFPINEVFTYKEFHEKFLKVAKYLENKNLKKGDRISVIIPNSPEFILIYFASLTSGITFVPINKNLASREILYIINNSKSKAVFYDYAITNKIEEIKNQIADKLLISLNKLPDFEPLKENLEIKNFEVPKVELNDEAVIIYTSGTTGNPKGVISSHLNLLSDSKAISEWFHFSPETRTLCVLPMFHNNGQVVTLLTPLYAGGSTVVVKHKVDFTQFWSLIKEYNINWTSVVPSILSMLLSFPNDRIDTTMRGIICGGQILTRAVQNNFETRFKVPIFEGYGLTETTSFACFNNYPSEKRKIGSIGIPLPVNEMIILDDEGNELKANQEGEICIRGLNVAQGYLDLPEKNKKSFENGWFHSGDFGYKDEYDYYYFKTRKDFLIIKGGENIYPVELENVLYQHPAVSECAVIGIPDEIFGEEICAFVKLKENIILKEDELKLFCLEKIAKFKQAKKIVIIDELNDMGELPKGPTKKILYRELKEYYMNNKEKLIR